MIRLLVSCGSECRLLSATVSNRYSQLLTNNHKYLSRALFSSQSAQSDDCYDIVINGGGIVGFSTLLALKRSPFLRDKKICLFERQSQPKETKLQSNENHFSNRVSSITKSSKKFFENIGVWNELEQFAKPVKEFYVWSQKYQSGINFRSDFDIDDDIRDDNNIVCYVIENNKILSSLQTAINQSKQNVCYETVVTNIAGDDHCIQIETKHINSDETNKLRTRLLIGSDGFQSIVRQKSNLELFEHDLEQFGIVGTVAVDPGEGNITNEIAFQRFVPFDRSVIALLPLNQDFSSFVWSVPKDSAKHLMEMSDHQFVDHMNDSLFVESNGSSASMRSKIDDLISRFVPKQLVEEPIARYAVPHVVSLLTDSRAMFPLKFSTTLPYLIGSPSDSKDNNRIVIIGDAAHRVHPLAGQGLNLGIGDATALSASIHKHLSRGETLFGPNPSDAKQLETCLFGFERSRQIKLIPMLSVIHSMQDVFTFVPTQLLSAFNSLEFIKQRIVKFANKT